MTLQHATDGSQFNLGCYKLVYLSNWFCQVDNEGLKGPSFCFCTKETGRGTLFNPPKKRYSWETVPFESLGAVGLEAVNTSV